MLETSRPPPYAIPLKGWEHLHIGMQTVSDLIKEENPEKNDDSEDGIQRGCSELEDDPQRLMPKMRTVKFSANQKTPVLSRWGYAWLAKTLS